MSDKTRKILNVFLSIVLVLLVIFISVVGLMLFGLYFPDKKYLILFSFYFLLASIFFYVWFKILKSYPVITAIITICFIVGIFLSYVVYMNINYPDYCSRKYFWIKKDCPVGCESRIVGFVGDPNGMHGEVAQCLPVDK